MTYQRTNSRLAQRLHPDHFPTPFAYNAHKLSTPCQLFGRIAAALGGVDMPERSHVYSLISRGVNANEIVAIIHHARSNKRTFLS